MRILYITTIGITMNFFKSFIGVLIEQGHEVDIATNENIAPVSEWYKEKKCKIYNISCSRSPADKGNIEAIKQIKKIVNDKHYDIVHCHTPIAAVCTRIACRKVRKQGTRVIYTAHGFHFYKGASLKNWLIFYPAERICSHWTDVLITINKEDYGRAKSFRAKQLEYVPGVGIDVNKFANVVVDREEKRRAISVPEDAFLMLSVGELNKNKNHEAVIRALVQIRDDKVHYAVAGEGELKEYLLKLAKELRVEKQVHLLGHRNDVAELYKAADIFVHPSFREGLPVSVMEAMASGLPCVVSDIRGNNDLVNEACGIKINPHDENAIAGAVVKFFGGGAEAAGTSNRQISEKYDFKIINEQLMEIYHTRI